MGRTRNLGKSKKQAKIRYIISIIVIAILIIIMSLFTINNYLLTNKYITELKKKHVTLDKLKNETIELNNKYKELESYYEEIQNTDALIDNAKKEVFSLASETEKKILNNKTNLKIAYITFDDGPYYLTDKVLQILKEKKIKATFFTIGEDKDTCYDNKNYSCKDTYKRIVDAGHTIANHTYSHGIYRGLYSNANAFMDQVSKQEKLIQDRTGVKTNILRFPGGIGTANALARGEVENIKAKLKERGYGWVDWTAQDGDGGYVPNYDTAWKNFTNTINEPIEVILFHDYSTITASMLPDAINYLEEKNYVLLPLFYDSVKINK